MVKIMETKRFKIDVKQIGITAAKFIIGSAASFGAGYIMTRYGKAVILPTDKTLKKVLMLVGATALAGAVGNAAESYVDEQIDNCVKVVDTISNAVKGISSSDDDDEIEEETDNG